MHSQVDLRTPKVEEKSQGFDAKPLYKLTDSYAKKFFSQPGKSLQEITKITPKMAALFGKYLSFDMESFRLIKIACKRKVGTKTRFAGLVVPERKNILKKTTFHLICQPTLPPTASAHDMKRMENLFGKGNVPKAKPVMTGLVHQDAGEIRKNQAILNRESRCDLRLMSELINPDDPEKNSLYTDPSNGNYVTRDLEQKIQQGNLLDPITGDPSIDLRLLTPDNLSNPKLRKKILDVTSRRKHTLPSEPYDCSLDFMLQEDLSFIFAGAMGLSFWIIIEDDGSIRIDWMGRSSMQFHVQEMSYLGILALLFLDCSILPNGTFEGRKDTFAFHMERSIQEDILLSIMEAATIIIENELNRDIQGPMIIVKSQLDPNEMCQEIAKDWRIMRFDKEKFAVKLRRNMYVAIGLVPLQPGEEASPFWINLSDKEIVDNIIKTAKQYNLALRLNEIPFLYKKQCARALPPLFLAITMKKFDIAASLIENGATPTETLILYAEKLGTPWEITGYLALFLELKKALLNNDIELFNKCLEKSTMFGLSISRPFYANYTLLDKAIELNRYEIVLRLLEEHIIDINASFPRTDNPPLAHAHNLEMQCLLLEKGAVSQLSQYDDSYYVAELWKKMPKQKKEAQYDPMKDNERLMQLLITAIADEKSKNTLKMLFLIDKLIKYMKKNSDQLFFNMPNNVADAKEETLLTYTLKKGCSIQIIESIIKADPSLLNKTNAKNDSPLSLAERLQQTETVSFLLRYGAYHPKIDDCKITLDIPKNNAVFQQPLASLFFDHSQKIVRIQNGEIKGHIVTSIKIGELEIVLSKRDHHLHTLNARKKNEKGGVKNVLLNGLPLSSGAIERLAELPDDTAIIEALFETDDYTSTSRKKLLGAEIKKVKNLAATPKKEMEVHLKSNSIFRT